MHKYTLKRSTINSSTQKIKAPEHLSRIQDYQDDRDDSSNRFQLPSLQKKKSWKNVDDSVVSWDENSAATSVSWSPEMEEVATWKLVQQWETMESTLYEDGEVVPQTAVLEECILWRTQIPHLRIVGKNPFLSVKDRFQDTSIGCIQVKSNADTFNEEKCVERSPSVKERKGLSQKKLQKTLQDKVIDILVQYVMSELFPSEDNQTDSLCDDLSSVLKIQPAPVYSNKSSAKSRKANWLEEIISFENRFSNYKNNVTVDRLALVNKDTIETDTQSNQKKHENSLYSGKVKSSGGGRGTVFTMDNRLYRPQTGRNKLGTVFKEKIVVSPVPYILSTRESFSTVRTTPIKFMGQSLDVSTSQGSSRNSFYFNKSAKSSTTQRISNCQSAWNTVSPAVWPKNIKLAPIGTVQLPNSKNRSLAPSPVVLQRNRKSLSPISHSALPASAQTVRDNNHGILEIRGKHIVPGQSPKLSLLSAGWDYSPRKSKSRRKNNRSKEGI